MKPRQQLVDDEFIGNPHQSMGTPPELFNREAALDDPWDASNEPDAFSPALMIQPGAEDVSEIDEADLNQWLGSVDPSVLDPDADSDLDALMVPGARGQLYDYPEADWDANEGIADDTLALVEALRGNKAGAYGTIGPRDPAALERKRRM